MVPAAKWLAGTVAQGSMATLLVVLAIEQAHAQTEPTQQGVEVAQKADASSRSGKRAPQARVSKPARDAGDVEASLADARAALEGGKADAAVKRIDALIAAGGLKSQHMAMALAIRGRAHQNQGKPAQAIADLQGALWMKNGLSDAERGDVMQARARAYRDAGIALPEGGEKTQKSAASSGGGWDSATARHSSTPPRSGTSPIVTAAVPAPRPDAAAPATSNSSGLGGFFSNLFGSGGGKQAQTSDENTRSPPRSKPSSPAVSSWTTSMASPTAKKSEPAAEAPTPKPVVNKASLPAARSNPQTAAAAPPAEVQKGNDSFVLRLAAQRSSAESKSLAERIRREYAAEIGNRGYRIDETTFGSEKFYVADVGPFGELDTARALCASIRNNGVDCHVVNR